jgi:hypothetical protein
LYNQLRHVLITVLIHQTIPFLQRLQRFLFRNIIDQHHPQRILKITPDHRPEPLLPSRIPHLQRHVTEHAFDVGLGLSRGVLDSDGGFGLDVELLAGEAADEAGLADAGVAEEDDFDFVLVGVGDAVHLGFIFEC